MTERKGVTYMMMLSKLLIGDVAESHGWLNCGPTTSAACSHLIRSDQNKKTLILKGNLSHLEALLQWLHRHHCGYKDVLCLKLPAGVCSPPVEPAQEPKLIWHRGSCGGSPPSCSSAPQGSGSGTVPCSCRGLCISPPLTGIPFRNLGDLTREH